MFLPPPMSNDDAKQRVSETPMPSMTPAAAPDSGPDEHEPPPLSPDVPQGDDLYLYVLNCLDKGSTPKDVRQQMIAFGYSAEEAEQVVAEVSEWRRQNPAVQVPVSTATSNAGNSDMMLGGIIFIIGVVVTVGSFAAASGGGSYIVAWGAIVFGAFRFLRGFSNSAQAQANEPPASRSDSRNARL